MLQKMGADSITMAPLQLLIGLQSVQADALSIGEGVSI
jgi:hypothetical protein